MKMEDFQVWYNAETGMIYETRTCQGWQIMYTPRYGSMWMTQEFVENPYNHWFYIGDL